jgi:hypothetical protein
VAEDDLGEGSTAACSRMQMLAPHFPQFTLPHLLALSRQTPVSSGQLAGIVDDLADYTTEVAMALRVVEVAELGRGLVQARVGSCNGRLASSGAIPLSFRFRCRRLRGFRCFDRQWGGRQLTENRSTPLALVANDTTHGG